MPEGLLTDYQATFVNEWALYLSDLGRFDGAICCYERQIGIRMGQQKWENSSIGNQNLTDVLVLAGRLGAASKAAAEALRLADRAAAAAAPSPQPSPPSTNLPKDGEGRRGRGGRTRYAPEADGFDVFLCHNSQDRSAVEGIARTLQERGLRPWLDKWELRPGLPWQRTLEDQIEKIGAAAVFVGPNGIGPWQQLEHEAFLCQFVGRQCPVIPVLLPGLAEKPRLPPFLAGFLWVDFNVSDPDPVGQLIWGITGDKPSSKGPTAK